MQLALRVLLADAAWEALLSCTVLVALVMRLLAGKQHSSLKQCLAGRWLGAFLLSQVPSGRWLSCSQVPSWQVLAGVGRQAGRQASRQTSYLYYLAGFHCSVAQWLDGKLARVRYLQYSRQDGKLQ
jgi:hypothetical protein